MLKEEYKHICVNMTNSILNNKSMAVVTFAGGTYFGRISMKCKHNVLKKWFIIYITLDIYYIGSNPTGNIGTIFTCMYVLQT